MVHFHPIVQVIFLVVSTLLAWNLIIDISHFFSSVAEEKLEAIRSSNIISISDRIKNTEELLPIIRALINNAITDVLKTQIKTFTKIKYENVDTLLNTIASQVYGALAPSIMGERYYVVNIDYIDKFIINESLNMLLNRIEEHNRSINKL